MRYISPVLFLILFLILGIQEFRFQSFIRRPYVVFYDNFETKECKFILKGLYSQTGKAAEYLAPLYVRQDRLEVMEAKKALGIKDVPDVHPINGKAVFLDAIDVHDIQMIKKEPNESKS